MSKLTISLLLIGLAAGGVCLSTFPISISKNGRHAKHRPVMEFTRRRLAKLLAAKPPKYVGWMSVTLIVVACVPAILLAPAGFWRDAVVVGSGIIACWRFGSWVGTFEQSGNAKTC